MRHAVLAAVLLLAVGAAIARDPRLSATTTDSSNAQAPAAPKAASQVRQSEDSDLIVKEWHSPITFDLDAGWLRTLPFGKQSRINDLPSFYCDGVTLDLMDVTKRSKAKNGVVELEIHVQLRARRGPSDKVVALEFTLVNGEPRLLLGRSDDLKVADGDWNEMWIKYKIANETFAAYTVDGSSPQLRVSMVVQDK